MVTAAALAQCIGTDRAVVYGDAAWMEEALRTLGVRPCLLHTKEVPKGSDRALRDCVRSSHLGNTILALLMTEPSSDRRSARRSRYVRFPYGIVLTH